MLSLKSCWSVSIKKSLIKQIRQTEKNDTPARVEYYGNPKAVTRMLVKLIEQGKLRYNGEDNYSRIIRSLTAVVDVVYERGISGIVCKVDTGGGIAGRIRGKRRSNPPFC